MNRTIDLVLSLFLIALSLPLMALIALAITAAGGGPALARETRGGAGGRRLNVLKFRTTARRAGREAPTVIGRMLWYTRMVDLPQLFNVLRGDMSLVDADAARPDFFD